MTGCCWGRRWPRPGLVGASCGRCVAAGGWGLAEPAALVASELITNGVAHAGMVLELRMELRRSRLLVAVADQDPNLWGVLAAKDGPSAGWGCWWWSGWRPPGGCDGRGPGQGGLVPAGPASRCPGGGVARPGPRRSGRRARLAPAAAVSDPTQAGDAPAPWPPTPGPPPMVGGRDQLAARLLAEALQPLFGLGLQLQAIGGLSQEAEVCRRLAGPSRISTPSSTTWAPASWTPRWLRATPSCPRTVPVTHPRSAPANSPPALQPGRRRTRSSRPPDTRLAPRWAATAAASGGRAAHGS